MNAQHKPIADNPPSQPTAELAPGTPPLQDSSILERMLEDGASNAQSEGLSDAAISLWSGSEGVLDDGRQVTIGASCLLRPEVGDRVLVWTGGDKRCFVLNVLQRANEQSALVWAADAPVMIEAPRIGIRAETVHVSGENFVSTTRNRHAAEDTRTETARLRVANVETDIRRAVTVNDQIKGSLIQRTGTWFSSTVREARFHARTFLFD